MHVGLSMHSLHVGLLLRGHPYMTSTRRGEGVRLKWKHVDGGRGQNPSGRPHRKLKLESTDAILFSSHAKKLVSLLTEFRLCRLRNKKRKVFWGIKTLIFLWT